MKSVEFFDLPDETQKDLVEALLGNASDLTLEEARSIMWTRCSNMSPEEVFDRWLRYNGIIGYTQRILEAWNGIQEATRDSNR